MTVSVSIRNETLRQFRFAIFIEEELFSTRIYCEIMILSPGLLTTNEFKITCVKFHSI